MKQTVKIPESVQKEISLYLSQGETIIDALASASGPVGKLGELWMILTDKTIFFHTREYGKEPIVALLRRKEIQVIKYEQHTNGVTLTFVPANRPRNTIRVPFPKSQRNQVNDFCERLASEIPFELVTDNSNQQTLTTPPAPLRSNTQEKNTKNEIESKLENKPSDNDSESQPKSYLEENKKYSLTNKQEIIAPSVKIVKTTSSRPQPQPTAFPEKSSSLETEYSYAPLDSKTILLITALSVIVGFIWYKLFHSIFNRS